MQVTLNSHIVYNILVNVILFQNQQNTPPSPSNIISSPLNYYINIYICIIIKI